MSNQRARPAWVIEQTIDASAFNCCGDVDLFPFKCSYCSQPYVLCYECDMLYPDLSDLHVQIPFESDAHCARCGVTFGADLRHSPVNRISFAEWSGYGFDALLIEVSPAELFEMLCASADQIAEWLRRGMLSTARTRLVEFRNLAEAMAAHAPSADELRLKGRAVATGRPVRALPGRH